MPFKKQTDTKTTERPYEYKISLGKDINGKLIRKSFYSPKSKADAKRKAEKYKAKYELELLCGGQEEHPRVLFETWALECLELYKKPFVKGNTYSGTYLAPVKQRLIPWFGSMPLENILPFHVQKYVNHMSESYSAESVKKDFTIFSFIMQHAADNGLCKANPAGKSIHLPKIQPPEKHVYSQEEYNTVYQFAASHPQGLAIMLLMETGITRSELLGLRWEDLDLDGETLTIRNGLVAYEDMDQSKWVVESSGLKNKYRQRSIPIVEPALLRQLRSKPRSIKVPSKGDGASKWIEPEFIFHSPEGMPYQPQNWSRRVFNRFMKDLRSEHPEIPRLTPHELRHTRATLWLAQGITPLMTMKLLGHSDLKMLSRIYDHTSVETLRTAIADTMRDHNEGL